MANQPTISTSQVEEVQYLDISKGLWLSPTADIIPDGYCQTVQNLFQTERGTWQHRKGFTEVVKINESSIFDSFSDPRSDQIPEIGYTHPKYINFGDIQGGVAFPQLFFIYEDVGGAAAFYVTVTGRRGAAGTVNVNTQAIVPANLMAHAGLAQYKDRTYIEEDSGRHVYRVTGYIYDGTSPALTSLNIGNTGAHYVGTSDPYFLINYANRIFYLNGDGIQYTELATTGGYPETWTAANLIDLPADFKGSASIRGAHVLNGLLYIFTTKGIFVLNAQGSPSNWSLQFITGAIQIQNKNSVAIVNGVFICTDYQHIYVFNGSSVKIIGEQVQYLFNIYNSFSVCPFEKGFILSCRYFTVSGNTWADALPTGASGEWTKTRSFYFDGSVWSEIIIGSNTDILFGCVGKSLSQGYQENLSFIVARNAVTGYYSILYYDKTANKDTINGASSGITTLLRTRDFTGKRTGFVRVKSLMSRVFCLFTNSNLTIYARKEGSVTEYSTTNFAPTTSSSHDNNFVYRTPGTDICTRYNLALSTAIGTSPTVQDTSLPDNVPLYEIKELYAIVDTSFPNLDDNETV